MVEKIKALEDEIKGFKTLVRGHDVMAVIASAFGGLLSIISLENVNQNVLVSAAFATVSAMSFLFAISNLLRGNEDEQDIGRLNEELKAELRKNEIQLRKN